MLIAYVKAQMSAQYPLRAPLAGPTLLDSRKHWRTVVREVAAARGIPVEAILGNWRGKRPVTDARQEAMYRIRAETPLSYPEIAHRLGGRDHTTIIHGVRAHAKRNNLPLPL